MQITYRIPGSLVVGELSPDGRGDGVVGNVDVALELDNSRGSVGVDGLAEVVLIPAAGGAVLGCADLGGVDDGLTGSGVGAEEGDDAAGADSLGGKGGENGRGVGKRRRQQAGGVGVGVIDTADEVADAGAARAGAGCHLGTELDEIGHGHAIALVRVVPRRVHGPEGNEGRVLAAGELGAAEDDRAVGAALTDGSRLGPGGGIVEAEADGAAGDVGALAVLEHNGAHVIGDVLPDAAPVGLASRRVLATGGRRVGGGRVDGVAGAEEDGLDGLARGGELGVGERLELAEHLGRGLELALGDLLDLLHGLAHARVGDGGGAEESADDDGGLHLDGITIVLRKECVGKNECCRKDCRSLCG